MQIDLLFQGFPGRMTRGYMSWSSVVYLEHLGKKFLFDTGGVVERPELQRRLQERGTGCEEIDFVVLSHFHHDHVYNIDYFKKARFLLHEKERDWVKSDPA